MKKENKEMLKQILRNQELIMKTLKIELPIQQKEPIKKVEVKKAPAKKIVKKIIGK